MGRGLFDRARQPAEAEPIYESETTLAAICKMRWLLAPMAFSAPKPSRPPPPPSCEGRFFAVPARIEKDRAVDAAPLGLVERIERFQTKLDSRLFPDGDVLIEAHIPLIGTRAGHRAARCLREQPQTPTTRLAAKTINRRPQVRPGRFLKLCHPVTRLQKAASVLRSAPRL